METAQYEFNQNPPVAIPNIIIKKNKILNKDILATKYDYDKLGSNGLIEIKPKIIKFSGFETNKNNIQKFCVVNSASISQRIHVLPPTSPYFQIKFEKKGNLAPGISEEIELIFKPSEYKYYFDAIKIHTETDKFQIPIHAYPVMNRENVREVFPKLIDFGYVEIGEQEKRVFPLICKIPLNFEFEFSFVKEHPDIYVHPNQGIIPGKGSIEVEISYTPSINVTIDVELELKISQFDFEPLSIKIKGTGKNKIEKHQKKTLLEPIKKIPSKKDNPLSEAQNTAKKEFKTLMKQSKKGKSLGKSLSFKENNEDINKKTLTNRQVLEKEFFEKSNGVFQLCKDRDIRFFTCLGDPYISEENRESILMRRDHYLSSLSQRLEFDGTHRYSITLNRDPPIQESLLPSYPSTWDTYKNNSLEMRQELIRKFVNKGTSLILQSRLMKRLAKIKEFLGDAKTKEDVKRKVALDCMKSEYLGVGKKDHVSFKFSLEKEMIEQLIFPYQHETSNRFSDFTFSVSPKMNFDDLDNYEEFARCDYEEFSYKPIAIPGIFLQPAVEIREERTGGEEEYYISGTTGSCDQTDSIIVHSPLAVLMKTFEFEFGKYITVHPSLRKFIRFLPKNECDEEFSLIAKSHNFQDCLDPYMDENGDFYVLKYEYLSKTPGYFSIHAINSINIEMSQYFKQRFCKEFEYGCEKESERKSIEYLKKEEEEDHFTDSDSDGDGPPEVLYEEFEDFIKKIESDDKTLKELREKNELDIYDEYSFRKLEISKNFENERINWAVVMPSKISDINKFIETREIKILIH